MNKKEKDKFLSQQNGFIYYVLFKDQIQKGLKHVHKKGFCKYSLKKRLQ